MGKAKPRHKNNRRHKSQPSGLPSVKDVELEEAELRPPKDDIMIQNIVDEVQSTNLEERLNGLRFLADLAENSETVENIIGHKVLKVIAPLLVDKNSEVRNLTAGILRNLSATGSAEICERLVKDDIMTPLLAVLQQYNEWKPESKTENSDTLLQIVNIIWNLCESDETALKYFNSANVLNILLRCLDYKSVGLDLSIAVCQCLNSVSEDNASVLSVLRSYETDLISLLSVFNSQDNKMMLLKTLAAGIVVNLNPSTGPWLSAVMRVMAEALAKDVRALVKEMSSELPLDGTPLTSETAARLDQTEALTLAQTTALEILANLTTDQDDEMETESQESADEDDAEANGWSEVGETQPMRLSPEVHEGLEKFKFVSTVYSKIESIPENVMDIISNCPATKKLAKRLVRLQCRAFLCLNNLVAVADMELLQGAEHLYSLVKHILRQRLCLNLPHVDADSELLEAVTAAIRAVLLRLAAVRFTVLGEITPNELEVMFNIGLSPEPRVQANVIRIVGTLGVLLSNDTIMVKMAGSYLLQCAEKQVSLWLTAEALDSLLDLFSEDWTDLPATEISLVPRLQALAPRLKAKVRMERKTIGDHYAVVSTVNTNLGPFIKYKGARISALNNT